MKLFPRATSPAEFVLDSPVAVLWRHIPLGTLYTDAVFRKLAGSGAAVPASWPVEVGDGVLAAGMPPGDADRFLQSLRGLSIHPDDGRRPFVWTAAVPLARRHGLPVARAAYLELAVRLALPLATIDPLLIATSPAAGVTLLP